MASCPSAVPPPRRSHPTPAAGHDRHRLDRGDAAHAAKVEDPAALLPAGTRVYIAHIDGTPIEDMVAAARRLAEAGFTVMPHFPARIIADVATLEDWIARYQGEAGVHEALLLAGGVSQPAGEFHSSMQLAETGLFDRAGFTRLHVAGHPEGNRDIDTDGGERIVMDALRWKQAFAERTDAEMAIVTQFAFEADPVIAWAERLRTPASPCPSTWVLRVRRSCRR